jgi:signal transduction histidine kinase/CheY-like chemotaxis protein
MFPLSIRYRLITLTTLPVIAVYVVILVVAVGSVYDHTERGARERLVADAGFQATRLALVLERIPQLARGIGDLLLSDPQQSQNMLYAHLIDGLRRTPIARRVAIRSADGTRAAAIERGQGVGQTAMPPGVELDTERGWRELGPWLRFTYLATAKGKVGGVVAIDLLRADVRAALNAQRRPDTRLLLGPPGGEPVIDSADEGPETALLQRPLPAITTLDQVVLVTTPADLRDYWAVRTALPALPLALTAITPVENALLPVHQAVGRLVVVLVASLLVIILVIGLVARRITEPLRALDAAVERIGRGDYTATPAVESNDEIGRLATAVDRMSRIIAEREGQLQQAARVLEQRVDERSRALQAANQQLLQQIRDTRRTEHALRLASRRAEAASRAKSDFLSNMTHELRTPLHGILGNAEMLHAELPEEVPGRDNLVAIERSGQHLLALINRILDLTRIESGRVPLERRPTDLRRLLQDVSVMVAERARGKGLAMHVEIDPQLPAHLETDALRLRQVLLNLLDNAIKFTRQGSVYLTAERRRHDRARFTVRDTGSGMAATEMARIFEAFQHAEESGPADGLGLGLAINQGLVRLLGASELSVESAPGDGSRFWFDLPLDTAGESSNGTAATAEQEPQPVGACASLLLEPDEGDRQVLQTWLGARQCRVDSCLTLAEAVRLLRQQRFDTVVVDIRQAGTQARQWATVIRQASLPATPRLIGMSRTILVDGARTMREAGFRTLLQKPFTEQELFAALRHGETSAPVSATGHAPPFLPLAPWPRELALDAAAQLDAALEIGDVAALTALAESLAGQSAAPQAEVQLLARMIRQFDFDGLRHFARELRGGSPWTGPAQ